MVSVVYCTRSTKPTHKEHLIKSSGLHKHIEIIEIINNGESLTSAYNRGLSLATNNIVVFCHDDLTVETKQWGNKLIKLFEQNPTFGIIGVAGSRSLPASGKWWEDATKMYGRVQHTAFGKSWLSIYSPDLGTTLQEVVNVDGLFFAVDKTRIKRGFNEEVKGFHFYDVEFSFANHLAGVKVGVTTIIRVNHQSVGITNDEWEANRVQFIDLYKDNLPTKLNRVLRKDEKLKVLIGCLNFNHFTGSELYVFELAKELIKQGCDVSVCSNIGEPLLSIAHREGIKMYSLQEPPNFKLGDGKWMIRNEQGEMVPSQQNNLYRVSDIQFDILHLNHKPVSEHLLRLYPNIGTVASIHSEVIALEEPVINPQIKKYVAIRPEIKDYIVNKFEIKESDVEIIYNPINYHKFKEVPTKKRDKKRIIFVGTIDYLRRNTIEDLIKTTGEMGQELWIVGKKNDNYLEDMIANQPHVTYFPPTLNVEKMVQDCDETAGILLGRTTIEGWLCGKGGWIYDVDSAGNILNKTFHEVPSDVTKFRSDNVANKIIELYKSVLD